MKPELRFRKDKAVDLEGGVPDSLAALQSQNADLEVQLTNQRKLVDVLRLRERKMLKVMDELGIAHDVADVSEELQDGSFMRGLVDRSSWLFGLLIFQSLSSVILRRNEELLQAHPTIVYFLTMLVGAGGNAGNQATVRAIRGIALGTLTKRNTLDFLKKELLMACILSIIMGIFGFARVFFIGSTTGLECLTVGLALVMIVWSSVVCGAILPIAFNAVGIDPAHSSTSIQVIMDISGVLITCFVATYMLEHTTIPIPPA
jgi:Mg/Co/Ni transporter MgtE